MTINVNKKKVVPDLIFFTAQRSENISFIFSLVKILTFSKYAFYFINNSLYFITLDIIKCMIFLIVQFFFLDIVVSVFQAWMIFALK